MSRKNHGQQAPKLKENEAYITQDVSTGEYRLMRDDFNTQIKSAATKQNYSPNNFVKPRAKNELKTELPPSAINRWKWARWGNDDRYPQLTNRKLLAVPIAGRAINDLVKLAYGEGLQYHTESDTSFTPTPLRKPEIESFLRNNQPFKILPAAYGAFYRFNCVFVVFTLDANRKIARIEIPDTAYCRFEIQDTVTLRSEHLLFSKKFGSQYTPTDEDIIAIPLLNEWDTEGWLSKFKGDKFAICLHGETPEMLYYPIQSWAGLLKENGWLDVSADIPIISSALNKNQISIKYKIGVDENRFENMYGSGWRKEDFKLNGKGKKDLRDEYWAEIENLISGTENAGKSIKYIFKSDPISGRILDDIVIEPIDDKLKKDQYIPTSQAADQQIVQALGIDPSMVGLQGMSTSLGGNSGSNKRVGYNQAVAMNTLDQDIVLECYNFVARYNGWGVCFTPFHIQQTTINNQESGLVPPVN